jgi:hypothetical protein
MLHCHFTHCCCIYHSSALALQYNTQLRVAAVHAAL